MPLIELDLSKLPKGTPKIASYEVKFDESTEVYKKTTSAPARDPVFVTSAVTVTLPSADSSLDSA